ncbi:hypothetical protein LCGC14_2506200, partial [marine sediment metagenome]
MKIEKKIHRIYKEYEQAKKKGINFPQGVGKYHYIFSNSKGKISLIKEIRSHVGLGSYWEIYCAEGNLFENTERFSTEKKAIERIKEYFE